MSEQATITQRVQTVDDADRARQFGWRNNPLEQGIGLALSGGGFRAMLFHAGALARLNEWGVLPKVRRIASVSGGSIAAGILASKWASLRADARGTFADFHNAFVNPVLEFSKQKLDVRDALIGLLPFTSIAAQVAGSYDSLLFHGKTLQDLPDTPEFVFCATNLQTGVLWRFTKAYAGDYVAGEIVKPTFRIADAVAASAAFPPVFSPVELKTKPADFRDWGAAGAADAKRRIDPAPFRQKIVLTDGGVYDNHGMEPIVKRFTTLLVSDGGAPFVRQSDLHTDWLNQLARITDLMDNQVRALRRRDLIARFQAGIPAPAAAEGAQVPDQHGRLGTYWGIDTHPQATLADAIPCSPAMIDKLAAVPTRLTDLGLQTSKQLINWGYAICDYCVRQHYPAAAAAGSTPPKLPYPEASLQ
jgi:NTE family protein